MLKDTHFERGGGIANDFIFAVITKFLSYVFSVPIYVCVCMHACVCRVCVCVYSIMDMARFLNS